MGIKKKVLARLTKRALKSTSKEYKTTVVGVTALAVIEANVNWEQLFSGNREQISLALVGALVGILGWFVRDRGKTEEPQ